MVHALSGITGEKAANAASKERAKLDAIEQGQKNLRGASFSGLDFAEGGSTLGSSQLVQGLAKLFGGK
ncbi:hypothetical protein JDN40_14365 [Rhodomicrobium vannielii ATCC 17100]|uniref:hypothetical protein n=1 Tax=Rhodomicrobium vannielii TaxID=1069 RepID=UPI001917B35E|nr:hypothetical protein [Rhodomicrobium vannielii]MBJ7535292.1 hypothetical protein [Rhodomicrobium vannielii ATCC 17100]